MASYTTNLNLKKPAGSENVAIGDINNNMDTIDQAYGTLNSKLTNKIKRKTVTVSCTAATWQSIPLSTLSQYDINETKIINVIPSYGQGRWINWRMASGNIIFLRLNTNGTDTYIDDTAGDFSLDIIYTDNIASSN